MTQADQATAGIDWEVAVSADAPRFDSLPTLARRGQAAVVDGHVFGHRKTIMGFQAVELGHMAEAGAVNRIRHGGVGVREDQWLAGAEDELGFQ